MQNFEKNAKAENKNITNNSIIEDWIIKERQAKFICNSSNLYNFFGYKHYYLFWDTEILNFFKNTPFNLKLYKKLYNKTLKNNFFKQFNLNFKHETQPTNKQIQIQEIKNQIKKYLPKQIKRKYQQKNDWLNNEILTKKITEKYLNNNKNIKNITTKYDSIKTIMNIETIKKTIQ